MVNLKQLFENLENNQLTNDQVKLETNNKIKIEEHAFNLVNAIDALIMTYYEIEISEYSNEDIAYLKEVNNTLKKVKFKLDMFNKSVEYIDGTRKEK